VIIFNSDGYLTSGSISAGFPIGVCSTADSEAATGDSTEASIPSLLNQPTRNIIPPGQPAGRLAGRIIAFAALFAAAATWQYLS
jgi:hypothetical protein